MRRQTRRAKRLGKSVRNRSSQGASASRQRAVSVICTSAPRAASQPADCANATSGRHPGGAKRREASAEGSRGGSFRPSPDSSLPETELADSRGHPLEEFLPESHTHQHSHWPRGGRILSLDHRASASRCTGGLPGLSGRTLLVRFCLAGEKAPADLKLIEEVRPWLER